MNVERIFGDIRLLSLLVGGFFLLLVSLVFARINYER